MSRSYKLCCLFCSESEFYTKKLRWKTKTNNPHEPKYWKKYTSHRLRRNEKKYLKDILSDENAVAPKRKNNLFYYLW